MMKRILLGFTFLLMSSSLLAQRVQYQSLVNRTRIPAIFIDEIALPGEDGKTTLAFTFRFNYDFLPFKKLSIDDDINAPEGTGFYSTLRLNSELFKGGSAEKKLANLQAASRDTWSDTLFANSFEDTQSNKLYASGSLVTQLEPGDYNYLLQLTIMNESSERNSRRRVVRIPDFKNSKTGEVILIRAVKESRNGKLLELMNMNDNVPFGDNFYALVRIPNYEKDNKYSVQVHEARISKKDTTTVTPVYTEDLTSNQFYTNSTVRLLPGEKPVLSLLTGNYPYTYALVKVPNSNFENSVYMLKVLKNDKKQPVASSIFKSYWPDMPASLYNLNISIDMLKFIVGEKQLKKIKEGSREQKEKKFKEFWASKDPTPNTVFNELMAEYYRRIDYAYREFGNQENPLGHESDQGEIYIKFGPPQKKERQFPTSGKVREVWTYNNRTFVFEATSGFGNFQLVATR